MENVNTSSETRIYVACLAAYNNGYLHGRWIDATSGEYHIWSEVKIMLEASPIDGAGEFAVHDFEGFHGISIGEYTSFKTIAALAEFVAEHGELGAELYNYFHDLDDAVSYLEDSYIGAYDSVADYVQELTEETTSIPDNLSYYIDYEKMARDMCVNDLLTFEIGNQVHIFWYQ